MFHDNIIPAFIVENVNAQQYRIAMRVFRGDPYEPILMLSDPGTGKTRLAALIAALYYWQYLAYKRGLWHEEPPFKGIYVLWNSQHHKSNLKNEFEKIFNAAKGSKEYIKDFLHYASARSDDSIPPHHIVLLDEVQELITAKGTVTVPPKKKTTVAKELLTNSALEHGKLMILTATPINNYMREMNPIISAFLSHNVASEELQDIADLQQISENAPDIDEETILNLQRDDEITPEQVQQLYENITIHNKQLDKEEKLIMEIVEHAFKDRVIYIPGKEPDIAYISTVMDEEAFYAYMRKEPIDDIEVGLRERGVIGDDESLEKRVYPAQEETENRVALYRIPMSRWQSELYNNLITTSKDPFYSGSRALLTSPMMAAESVDAALADKSGEYMPQQKYIDEYKNELKVPLAALYYPKIAFFIERERRKLASGNPRKSLIYSWRRDKFNYLVQHEMHAQNIREVNHRVDKNSGCLLLQTYVIISGISDIMWFTELPHDVPIMAIITDMFASGQSFGRTASIYMINTKFQYPDIMQTIGRIVRLGLLPIDEDGNAVPQEILILIARNIGDYVYDGDTYKPTTEEDMLSSALVKLERIMPLIEKLRSYNLASDLIDAKMPTTMDPLAIRRPRGSMHREITASTPTSEQRIHLYKNDALIRESIILSYAPRSGFPIPNLLVLWQSIICFSQNLRVITEDWRRDRENMYSSKGLRKPSGFKCGGKTGKKAKKKRGTTRKKKKKS